MKTNVQIIFYAAAVICFYFGECMLMGSVASVSGAGLLILGMGLLAVGLVFHVRAVNHTAFCLEQICRTEEAVTASC